MTPADASELLTIAATFDKRKIGRADAVAWADALAGLNPADCAQAIRAHFRESTDYLMPVHVRRGVQRIRADRVRANFEDFAELDAFAGDPIAYQNRLRELRAQVADGTYRPQTNALPRRPVAELVAANSYPSPPAFDHGDTARARARRAFAAATREAKAARGDTDDETAAPSPVPNEGSGPTAVGNVKGHTA